MTWPMCGAPTGQECPACAEAGRICYHDERAEADLMARINELEQR